MSSSDVQEHETRNSTTTSITLSPVHAASTPPTSIVRTGPRLDKLPLEILNRILDYSHVSGLYSARQTLNLRLLCRQLQKDMEPWFCQRLLTLITYPNNHETSRGLRTLYIRLSWEGINQLAGLADFQVVRDSVERIVFTPERHLDSYLEGVAQICGTCSNPCFDEDGEGKEEDSTCDFAAKENYWMGLEECDGDYKWRTSHEKHMRYHERFHEQEWAFASGESQRLLTGVLRRLKKVREVYFWGLKDASRGRELWEVSEPTEMAPYSDRGICTDWRGNPHPFRYVHVPDGVEVDCISRAVSTVLDAVHNSGMSIDWLTIARAWIYSETPGLWAFHNLDRLTSLKNLELVINHGEGMTSCGEWYSVENGITRFLDSAPPLETLSLSAASHSFLDHPFTNPVFHSPIQKLKQLRLSNFFAAAEDVVKFLQSNRHALREVRLVDGHLVGEQWGRILEVLHEDLELERLCLGSLFALEYDFYLVARYPDGYKLGTVLPYPLERARSSCHCTTCDSRCKYSTLYLEEDGALSVKDQLQVVLPLLTWQRCEYSCSAPICECGCYRVSKSLPVRFSLLTQRYKTLS